MKGKVINTDYKEVKGSLVLCFQVELEDHSVRCEHFVKKKDGTANKVTKAICEDLLGIKFPFGIHDLTPAIDKVVEVEERVSGQYTNYSIVSPLAGSGEPLDRTKLRQLLIDNGAQPPDDPDDIPF